MHHPGASLCTATLRSRLRLNEQTAEFAYARSTFAWLRPDALVPKGRSLLVPDGRITRRLGTIAMELDSMVSPSEVAEPAEPHISSTRTAHGLVQR